MSTAYTPLESLLLFQGLRTAAEKTIDTSTFNRISEELKAIPLVQYDPTYDAARLSADALRQLYLDLLKEEAKHDLERQLNINGDSPNTRKRKAPSPRLPTVQDATQHSHLIPQLITRLYTRYREITTAHIREQEQKHDQAAQEIVDVKAGRLDEDLQKQAASTQTSPKIPVSLLIQSEDAGLEERPSQARIDAVINHGQEPTHRRTSSGTVLPPFSEMASRSPQYPQSFQQSPSAPQPATFPPHAATPQLHEAHRLSASPRPVLPPPPGMAGSPMASPAMQSPQMYQQIRAQPQQSAYNRNYQLNQPPHLPPPQHAYYQQQQQYADRRTSFPVQQYQQPANRVPMPAPYPDFNKLQQRPQQYPNAIAQQIHTPLTAPRPQHVSQNMSDVLRALTTPSRLPRPPVWKSEKQPPPIAAPGSPSRPVAEPLSPVLARAPSPIMTARRGRPKKKRDDSIAATETVLRQTKSESPTHIKNESYVADSEDEPAPSMTTRGRRGTLTQPLKRRREDEPPARPTTIVATKNFSRMSTTIMNDLSSHKHGSRFAQPVRDRDADGYSSFVKRPQDLKSIRAAIMNGGRTLAAMNEDAPTTPGRAAEATVELDRSAELMPPKAIVNGAQLERELMRMFANAVMFNPGEDGMVADTREMFEDVEEKIAQWRNAERELAAGDEEDESRAKRRKL